MQIDPGQVDPGRLREALPGSPWEVRLPALKRLFENIEPRYDRLNRALSAGLDQGWRRWAARALLAAPDGPWVDLASGTGDLSVFLAESATDRRRPDLIRTDLSSALLRAGGAKLMARGHTQVPAAAAEMGRLPFRDRSVAAIAQGLALRHCHEYRSFFQELFRVLMPGGRVSIVDMRYPRDGFGATPYRVYFERILPRLAARLGGDRSAYEFMVDSVKAMPAEAEFLDGLREAGFDQVDSRRGIFGSVRLLTALRPR